MAIPLYDPRECFEQLKEHIGHKIEIVGYGNETYKIFNVAVECETCGTVLIDFDNPNDDNNA
jgi:hypothetical protein